MCERYIRHERERDKKVEGRHSVSTRRNKNGRCICADSLYACTTEAADAHRHGRVYKRGGQTSGGTWLLPCEGGSENDLCRNERHTKSCRRRRPREIRGYPALRLSLHTHVHHRPSRRARSPGALWERIPCAVSAAQGKHCSRAFSRAPKGIVRPQI